MSQETPSSRCERLARMVGIWNRVPSLDEVVEKIDAVTVERVAAFADSLVASQKTSLALYGPVSETPSLEALNERLAA